MAPRRARLWKLYRLLPDAHAAAHRQLRVVDESGEDYLFPEACFKAVELSPALVRLYGRGGRGTAGRATIKTAEDDVGVEGEETQRRSEQVVAATRRSGSPPESPARSSTTTGGE